MTKGYKLLDSGNSKKVEIYGDYKLIRPCPQAIWKPFRPELWEDADKEFIRAKGDKGTWKNLSDVREIPVDWVITSENKLKWHIELNDFGNVGVFTEHWTYAPDLLNFFDSEYQVLSLFSYSGSNCVELAKNGYKITVVDSSKNAISLYNKNLEINSIPREGQRLIFEDAVKFCEREVRRKNQYKSIIVDAPSYGRGTKGEIFDIENGLLQILQLTKQLLTNDGRFILTMHSPRYTPAGLAILITQMFPDKPLEISEILNPCESGIDLPSGYLIKLG